MASSPILTENGQSIRLCPVSSLLLSLVAGFLSINKTWLFLKKCCSIPNMMLRIKARKFNPGSIRPNKILFLTLWGSQRCFFFFFLHTPGGIAGVSYWEASQISGELMVDLPGLFRATELVCNRPQICALLPFGWFYCDRERNISETIKTNGKVPEPKLCHSMEWDLQHCDISVFLFMKKKNPKTWFWLCHSDVLFRERSGSISTVYAKMSAGSHQPFFT